MSKMWASDWSHVSSRGILRTQGPGLPKTPHSTLGQSSDSHPVPLVHTSPWVGCSCSSGSVLESVAHTETRKPGEQGAALFPCKDIRKRPQLPSDLLLYQELKQTREDMRRAGVQLLHLGARLLPCSVNSSHCLTWPIWVPSPWGLT